MEELEVLVLLLVVTHLSAEAGSVQTLPLESLSWQPPCAPHYLCGAEQIPSAAQFFTFLVGKVQIKELL